MTTTMTAIFIKRQRRTCPLMMTRHFFSTASLRTYTPPSPLLYPSDRIKAVLLENIHPMAVTLLEKEGYLVESHTRALSGQELIDVAGN
jgi:hypothetical protein